jgi:hypothetical protein
MNLDAIFIKLYVEENKLDYSTEENALNMSLDALKSENKPLKQVMSLGFPFLSQFAKKMANTWTSNAIKEQGTVGV